MAGNVPRETSGITGIVNNASLLGLILAFASPRAAFDSRLVCKAWNEVVNNGSSSFWRHVVGACVPSCEMTIRLLERASPKYRELRHFSKMSLANSKTLQHVIVCDIINRPLLWLTNVAGTTPVALLYKAVSRVVSPFLDDAEIVLLASGLPLERTKTLEEHQWPVRGKGNKGWRLDMLIVIRAFHYARAALKKVQPTASIVEPTDEGEAGDDRAASTSCIEAEVNNASDAAAPTVNPDDSLVADRLPPRPYPRVFPVDIHDCLSANLE